MFAIVIEYDCRIEAPRLRGRNVRSALFAMVAVGLVMMDLSA
jgi:hypothetical protein